MYGSCWRGSNDIAFTDPCGRKSVFGQTCRSTGFYKRIVFRYIENHNSVLFFRKSKTIIPFFETPNTGIPFFENRNSVFRACRKLEQFGQPWAVSWCLLAILVPPVGLRVDPFWEWYVDGLIFYCPCVGCWSRGVLTRRGNRTRLLLLLLLLSWTSPVVFGSGTIISCRRRHVTFIMFHTTGVQVAN